jgi:hypothetical protein
MTNKNPKTTDKKVKTTENDFRIVAEGKLKGRKDISKDEKKDNPWNCEWDNVHGDVIHFR